MCEPLTLTALAVGVASAGLQVAQSKQQADAAKAANRAAEAEANRNFALESANIQSNQNEAAATAANQRIENTIAAEQARGRARAAFAGSGTRGGALQAVLDQFSRQEGTANANIGQRLRFGASAAELSRQASFSRTVRATALNRRDDSFGFLDIGSGLLTGVNSGLSVASAGGAFNRAGKNAGSPGNQGPFG